MEIAPHRFQTYLFKLQYHFNLWIKTSLWRTCIHFLEALTTGTWKCTTHNSHHHRTFKLQKLLPQLRNPFANVNMHTTTKKHGM